MFDSDSDFANLPILQQHHMDYKQFQHNRRLQDQNNALALLDLEQADHEVDVHNHFLNSMANPLDDNLTFFLILLNFQLSDQAYIYSKELDELHMKELKCLYSL